MAEEKYTSQTSYLMARGKYALLRSLLQTTAQWQPLKEPQSGYTVIIGVPWQLWDLVDISLLSLKRANREQLYEVILAIDTTESQMQKRYGSEKIAQVLNTFAELNPRLIYYNLWQQKVCSLINWNWVDCWLTWVLAIAQTQTRYALLQDFDAVVIDPDFYEKQYKQAREADSIFVGIQKDDQFKDFDDNNVFMTVQLMLDAAYMRSHFIPIELFNNVRRFQGFRILCDILRDVQLQIEAKKRTFYCVNQSQLVHPSQVVSQWHKLIKATDVFTPTGYTPLLVVPYFRHLAGNSNSLKQITENLKQKDKIVELEGKKLDLSNLDRAGLDWIAKQIDRLDGYFSENSTDIVKKYSQQIRNYSNL